MTDVLRIDGIERRLGEAQIVDSIQQIGLTLTIKPDKAVELVGKRQVRLLDVLEIDDM